MPDGPPRVLFVPTTVRPDIPATIHVEVADEFARRVDTSFVANVAGAVLEDEGPFDDVEVTVRVTGDEELQRLNLTYRGIDGSTDVLSFGSELADADSTQFVLPGEAPNQLGDVVISLERAEEQAREYGHDLSRELGWLVVHGTLQLLGYRHDTPSAMHTMRAREERILRRLGLSIQRELDSSM